MIAVHSFRIKGSYYYSAQLAHQLGALRDNHQLLLIAEPNNPYDKNAIQVWLSHPRYLLGYIPRQQTIRFHFWRTFHLLYDVRLDSAKLERHRLTLYAKARYQKFWWHPFSIYFYKLFKSWL